MAQGIDRLQPKRSSKPCLVDCFVIISHRLWWRRAPRDLRGICSNPRLSGLHSSGGSGGMPPVLIFRQRLAAANAERPKSRLPSALLWLLALKRKGNIRRSLCSHRRYNTLVRKEAHPITRFTATLENRPKSTEEQASFMPAALPTTPNFHSRDLFLNPSFWQLRLQTHI